MRVHRRYGDPRVVLGVHGDRRVRSLTMFTSALGTAAVWDDVRCPCF